MESRKRSLASNTEFWGSKRRKQRSETAASTASASPRSSRLVATILALTDPTVVTNVMQFIPVASSTKRGEVTRVVGTLVSLCRAVAPFDHSLPGHFGPHNQPFWQQMVLRYFDFTTREAMSSTTMNMMDGGAVNLALWTRLGVAFVPREYGFLRTLQAGDDMDAKWPSRENAFTLFGDLTLLVDKLKRVTMTSLSEPKQFVACVRRPGCVDASSQPKETRRIAFLSRIRRSRRDRFRQLVTTQMHGWTHFRAHTNVDGTNGRIDFYAGQSRRSNRWIGFTSVCQNHA